MSVVHQLMGPVLALALAAGCSSDGSPAASPSPSSGGSSAGVSGSSNAGAAPVAGTGGTPTGGAAGSAATSGSGGTLPQAGTGGSGGFAEGGASPIVTPTTVVLDGQQLAEAKAEVRAENQEVVAALNHLLAMAEPDLTRGPWSVMDKTIIPPSGDKHDYISMRRYWWPTEGSPDGCPYTRRDGETNPDTESDRWDHASRHAAMDAIHNLALAWYFTDDPKYSERAALVARTWFLDPATKMNPNVNFGEHVPCMFDGSRTGVLNWTELIGQVLDGISILDTGAPGWTEADQTAMRAWITEFLDWHLTDQLALDEEASSNNHATWYDTGVAPMMLYLGQVEEARALAEAAKTKRIAAQIAANGNQPQETNRTNSWGYANWNIEGLCRLASTAALVDVDLWTYEAPNGASIVGAIDYLVEGATLGQSVWPHQQISDFQPSWALSKFHAAADFADHEPARAAIPLTPVPPEGDLWPLLKVCVPAAIQPN